MLKVPHLHAVKAEERVLAKHRLRRAHRPLAVPEKKQASVAEAAGGIDVMQACGNTPSLVRKLSEQQKDSLLVGRVEVIRGFVEKAGRRVLAEQHGNLESSALSAGKRIYRPFFESPKFHSGESLPGQAAVIGALPPPEVQVRVPVHVFDTRRQVNRAIRDLTHELDRTPTDEEWLELFDRAHERNLRIVLMPKILLSDPRGNEWRGKIQPTSWDAWFEEPLLNGSVPQMISIFAGGVEIEFHEDGFEPNGSSSQATATRLRPSPVPA